MKITQYHKRVIIDEWIVMSDHVHLLIELGNWDYDNGISLVMDSVGKIHGSCVRSKDDFSLNKSNPTKDELK